MVYSGVRAMAVAQYYTKYNGAETHVSLPFVVAKYYIYYPLCAVELHR